MAIWRKLRRAPADPVAALRAEVESALRAQLAWVADAPSGEATWSRVEAECSSYLLGLWRDGRLVGRARPEAFYVQCDETTTAQADRDAARVVALAGFAALAPGEFEIVRLELQAAA